MKASLNPPMNPRRRFLLILSAITLILTCIALIPRTKKSTPTPQNTTNLSQQTIKQAVIKQLPHTNSDFTIEYLSSSDTFMVTLENDTTAKKAAEDWLSARGLIPENITVIFNSFRRAW